MKRLTLPLLFITLLISACQEDAETTDSSPDETKESNEWKEKYQALKQDAARKDSVINDAARMYREIEENLSQIAYEEGRIRETGMSGVEGSEDPKQFILQEIELLNKLRLENQRKVERMENSLQEANMKNTEFQKLIDELVERISRQEEEIAKLRVELEDLDTEYTELFEAYTDMADMAEDRENKLNKAYYCYGTFKELKENGVVTKEGGFIGINRVEKLRSDFNKDYFEQIDIYQTKRIEIIHEKAEVITTHPPDSFELRPQGEITVLDILDPEAFWSVSKYLVVIVD